MTTKQNDHVSLGLHSPFTVCVREVQVKESWHYEAYSVTSTSKNQPPSSNFGLEDSHIKGPQTEQIT